MFCWETFQGANVASYLCILSDSYILQGGFQNPAAGWWFMGKPVRPRGCYHQLLPWTKNSYQATNFHWNTMWKLWKKVDSLICFVPENSLSCRTWFFALHGKKSCTFKSSVSCLINVPISSRKIGSDPNLHTHQNAFLGGGRGGWCVVDLTFSPGWEILLLVD